MAIAFRPASKKKSRLRLALDGPSGSGKTFTALRFAFALAGPAGRVAVINTESGAVEKYAGLAPDGIPWDFSVCEPESFAPSAYTEAIVAAGKAGFHVLVVDSLSHAWQGDGGALDQVSRKGGNSYTAWKDVTPQHNRMVEAILRSPCHVIVTMRSKMEYVLEEQVNKAGIKVQVPRKVGMAPIQRAGMEYEFDVVGDMDHTHTLTVSKTRCPDIDGAIVCKPGAAFIEPVAAWLSEGSDVDPSYYATKETDLKADVPTPPAPQAGAHVDPLQAMRERAAAAKANEGGDLAGATTETAPQLVGDPHRPTPISDKQFRRIQRLRIDSGVTDEVFTNWLRKCGVEFVLDLSALHASDTEEWLTRMIAANASSEPVPEPAPQPPVENASPNTEHAAAALMATQEQIDEVQRLFAALKTPPTTIDEILTRRGAVLPGGRVMITQLTHASAADLISKLTVLLERQRVAEFGFTPEQVEQAKTGVAPTAPEDSPALDGPAAKKATGRRGRKASASTPTESATNA